MSDRMNSSGPDLPAAGDPAFDAPDLLEDDAREALLDLATTAAGIGTFDWDLVTGTLDWDDQLIALFGYDPATFDRSIASFNARLHPEDLTWVTDTLQHAIDTCGDYQAEYRVLPTDGQVRWVAARGRALCDEDGTTVRLLGAAWDVTARRQTQERATQLLEGLAVGFLALDRDWVISHVNAEAERITGLDRAAMLGTVLWKTFPGTLGTDFERHYRQAVQTGQPVTFDAYYPAPLDIWVEVRAVPELDGLSLYFLDVTARVLERQRAERASQREQLLGRLTEQLVGTLDIDEAVQRLARSVVPTLGDWCVVTLIDDDHQAGSRRGLRSAGAWHTDPDLQPVAEAYASSRLAALSDDALVLQALTTGHLQLLDSDATAQALAMLQPGPVHDLLRRLAPEAIAVLPLPGRLGPVGMLTLCSGATRGPFTAEELATAGQVATRAGLVLDNARLYRQQRDLAEGLQRSLLTPPPEPDHMQVSVRYTPAAQAAQVGGDWYDAFLQSNGATVLVIGDVVGHDTRAAAAMSQVRTIVRTIGAQDNDEPVEVLRKADRVMDNLQVGTAATAVVARFEQSRDQGRHGVTRLRWSNAGHPPPMVVRPDGTVLPLTTPHADLLLGVRPDAVRRQHDVELDRGSVVVLYTDGLVERRDQSLDEGLDRLQQTLAELAGRDLEELCDELLARMVPADADDDVALVAVRLHPQDQPRPPEAGPERVPPGVPSSAAVADRTDES